MLALRYDCYRGYQEQAENDIFVFAQPIMSTPGHVLAATHPRTWCQGGAQNMEF